MNLRGSAGTERSGRVIKEMNIILMYKKFFKNYI